MGTRNTNKAYAISLGCPTNTCKHVRNLGSFVGQLCAVYPIPCFSRLRYGWKGEVLSRLMIIFVTTTRKTMQRIQQYLVCIFYQNKNKKKKQDIGTLSNSNDSNKSDLQYNMQKLPKLCLDFSFIQNKSETI